MLHTVSAKTDKVGIIIDKVAQRILKKFKYYLEKSEALCFFDDHDQDCISLAFQRCIIYYCTYYIAHDFFSKSIHTYVKFCLCFPLLGLKLKD